MGNAEYKEGQGEATKIASQPHGASASCTANTFQPSEGREPRSVGTVSHSFEAHRTNLTVAGCDKIEKA